MGLGLTRAIMSLMRIVVLVGLPGSGKSTWLARMGPRRESGRNAGFLICAALPSVYDTLGNGGRLCPSRSPICKINETQSCDRFLSGVIFARVRLPAPVAVAATPVAIATAPMIQATARICG